MISKEHYFLLLTSFLGNPERNPLTTPQIRKLAQHISLISNTSQEVELTQEHLTAIGVEPHISEKVLRLLSDEPLLEFYLSRAKKQDCHPVTRNMPEYPLILRKRLGLDSPGCLWFKGDLNILRNRAVSLVGSRELNPENMKFAKEVGLQAAKQGFTLISGNAKGADCIAQNACLDAGGSVICIVADSLLDHPLRENVLFLSEDDFDQPFTAQRALHRNSSIHALGEITFVAQCTAGKGGTWDGSINNLRKNWSPIFAFRDGSIASKELELRGATLIGINELSIISHLNESQLRLFG